MGHKTWEFTPTLLWLTLLWLCPEKPCVTSATYNKVTFAPVTTTALRVEVQLQDGFSGGILCWRNGS